MGSNCESSLWGSTFPDVDDDDYRQPRVSDLLTDHSYAMAPSNSWSDCFDVIQDWCPELEQTRSFEVGSQSLTVHPVPLNNERSFPNTNFSSLNTAVLDTIFSQIDVHVRGANWNQVEPELSQTSTVCTGQGCLSGSASEVFRLLYRIASTTTTTTTSSGANNSTELERDNSLPGPPLYLVPCSRQNKTEAKTPPSSHSSSTLHVSLVKQIKSRRKMSGREFVKDKNITRLKHMCVECGRHFARKFALNEHLRMVHEKDPPHKCPSCGHGFKRPALLRDHIYSKHAHQHRFVCPMCSKGFIRRPDCLRHFRRHHSSNSAYATCGSAIKKVLFTQ